MFTLWLQSLRYANRLGYHLIPTYVKYHYYPWLSKHSVIAKYAKCEEHEKSI